MGMHGKHQQQGGEEEVEGTLHGDVLDAVISRVSALDLLPASRVSKAWRAAVVSSVRHSPRRPPPWLVLYLQGRRGTATTHAFDPLSRAWRSITRVPWCSFPAGAHSPAPQVSTYACSQRGGTRLYALSPSGLALARDPFSTVWRELEAPRYWRTDPVVALVGPHVVVAGGTSEFEDDANSVDVHDACSGGWEASEPMPEAFGWSSAFSAAANGKRLYVMDKWFPFTASWFDPAAKRWGPTRRVSIPDPTVRHAALGFGNGRLLLAGAGGSGTGAGWRAESVRLWAVDEETLQVEEEVGRMPREMVEGLVDDAGWGLWSIGFLSEGDYAYVYNPSYLGEFFLCEFEEGGGCRWERILRPTCVEARPMHRVVFGCSEVSMDDLKTAAN
ncbi:F-box/kelch-repeat protein At1g23390-like [Musa acuminata AAA Group]|uniref:F-box/kelch-repeat protein At1g23390-like n=1 Tax=Musa acuminata AAA Group TaxID=214697 RepID=UPI0031CEF409